MVAIAKCSLFGLVVDEWLEVVFDCFDKDAISFAQHVFHLELLALDSVESFNEGRSFELRVTGSNSVCLPWRRICR